METGASMNKDATAHRIVVGVDGSEHSMAALEWAAVQAQRTGVALEVVAAFGPGYQFLSRSEADKCMREDVAEAMVMLDECGARYETMELAERELAMALDALERTPLASEPRAQLAVVARYVIERTQ